MKNILMIITKLSNGGAERAINLLSKNLSDKYDVKIVTFDNSSQEYMPYVEVIDLKTKITKNPLKKILHFFTRIYKVRKIKKQYKIDCTISFLPGPNIVNVLSKIHDRTIISVRNTQSKLKKNIFRNLVNQISFNKADKIVTVCDYVKEDILNTYTIKKDKIVTIYNTYNEEEIEKKKAEKIDKTEQQYFSKNKTVITVGRLIKQKGQWHLIRAFKEVVKELPDAKLIILGRGELQEYLKNVIKINQLDKNVYLCGFKENPYKYMQHSDIFVLPSLYEGMPNVILEAMSCNLPIIATNCEGGNKEILGENQYGILINKLDGKLYLDEPLTNAEEEMKNAIINILTKKQQREKYIEKSKERIEYFKKENNIRKWIDILEKKI